MVQQGFEGIAHVVTSTCHLNLAWQARPDSHRNAETAAQVLDESRRVAWSCGDPARCLPSTRMKKNSFRCIH